MNDIAETPNPTIVPRARERRAVVAVALTALALMSLFVGLRLAVHKGDPSVFMLAGDLVVNPKEAPANLRIYKSAYGYDGERYYRLARNPFTDKVTEFGISFQRPAYWQQRIGYPFLAWIVSGFGQERWTPAGLIITNLLADAVLAAIAARLALDHGRSAWWGLVPALWGGYVVALGQDLTEVVCGAFLLGGILAIERRRWAVAAACLTAAALTRESSLIFSVALLFAAVSPLVRRKVTARKADGTVPSGRVPAWVAIVPLGTYLAWRLWMRSKWAGAIAGGPESDALLGPPLVALLSYIGRTIVHPSTADPWNIPELILMVLTVIWLVRTFADQTSGQPHERLAFVAVIALLACLPVWSRGQAYLRWTCEPLLLGWLLTLRARPRRSQVLAVLVAMLWLVTTAEHMTFPGLSTAVNRSAAVSGPG